MNYTLPWDFSAFGRHLWHRGLKPWHRCWVDPAQEVVTFPLWSFKEFKQHRLIGYQRYNWREVKIRDNGGKYFTWVNENYKDRVAYGLENCYGHGPLFIVEGIWDSLRVVNCYFDCLALLTCSPSKNLKGHLRQLAGKRPIVALCDNDDNKSGDRLKSAADRFYYPPHRVKDVNELSHEQCFAWLTDIQREIRESGLTDF